MPTYIPSLAQKVNDVELDKLIHFFLNIKTQCPCREELAFICIGTDRSTGDAFGPLVGSMLKALGFTHIYGTIEEPCDADHVDRVKKILEQSDKTVIAIDAALGSSAAIGTFLCKQGGLVPGAGVGRKLPELGHYSIAGVVNKIGLKSYWQLQHTSLYLIYQMVYTLEVAIKKVWGVEMIHG